MKITTLSLPGLIEWIYAMRVTINENEEVEVGDDTNENYYAEDPRPVNDSVFKCSTCQTGTIHQGWEFEVFADVPELEGVDPRKKRTYICTNCGKFSTK